MKKKRGVLILSGGLDSTTLLYDLLNQGYEIFPLSFDYGQKHKKELNKAKITCSKLGFKHKIVKLNILNDLAPSALTRKEWKVPNGNYKDDNMKQTVVPNRNMIMLSLATAYAISLKAEYLFYGAHAGDHTIYPDCRKEFVKSIKETIKLCDWNQVTLKVPYINIDKIGIVKRGLKLKVPYQDTWTCYKGKRFACGVCGSCGERLEAFEKNDSIDPIIYKEETK